MKPYNGGKAGAGTYQHIINHIPPHSTFVSLFAGHCGVFRNIRRAAVSILNDNNPAVIDTWKKTLKTTNVIVTEDFAQSNILFNPELDLPARPIVILRNNDYGALLQRLNPSYDTFIYCDPPYPFSTRGSQARLYMDNWETDEEHLIFLRQIRAAKFNCMVSCYANEMYDNALIDRSGWNYYKFKSTTRNGLREETIYFNYPPPQILHDFQYLGRDYRERENIKRKTRRALDKMQRLPPKERTAILSAIVNEYKEATQKLITV